MEIGPVTKSSPEYHSEETNQKKGKVEPRHSPAADTVQISDDGRARLAEAADRLLAEKGYSVLDSQPDGDIDDGDRIGQIRRRIEQGYYERPDVRSEIADRLIDDLDI
ncbi:MAG: flagellar biosynthesis anti-sigma factor FlgM [candidate division Zixibacteria bacterium]|nr:flagellar biosynthesis anti-sigma factor FlgM [candidate division Zixibacteria bacterium]